MFLDMLHFADQFAEAYRNLQDINRRHLYVHEPLIYDAVGLAGIALHFSEYGPEFNITHNTTSKIPRVEEELQYFFKKYYYSGLTVSLVYHVHDTHSRTRNDTHANAHTMTHTHTHAHGSNMYMLKVFNMELLVSPCSDIPATSSLLYFAGGY